MIRYIKMKKMEIGIKLALYGYISALLNEKKEMLELCQKLYEALKEASPEDIRESFIHAIAELAHEQAVQEQKNGKMQ